MSVVNVTEHSRARVEAGRARPAILLTALACLFSALALIPPAFVVYVSVDTGWETVKALVFRPRVAELLGNTLWLIALTVPLCVAVGVLLAWLTERTTLAGRRVWSVLAVAPLAIPAFVQSYAWVSAIPSLHGLPAGVFLSVLAYYPFIYLPVSAVLRRLDPTLEDVAASLGSSPLKVFWRVVLPQLKLPVWGGALLVALHLLAEYGLYAMIRFDTFTTAIYDQFQSTFSGPAANMLAGVLALCCLVILTLEGVTRGKVRYARVGSGAAREQQRGRLSPGWQFAGQLFALSVILLAFVVPLTVLGRWLWLGGVENWQHTVLWLSLQQTLLLSAVGAAIVVLAGVPVAWLSVRYPRRLFRLLEGCNYFTSSLPGIVVALALVTVTIHHFRPIYQTEVTLFLAYLLMFAPRALINLRAGIAQAPVELENAARSLGRTPAAALWSITLRLAAPGAAAGAALVFLGISNELTATLLLSPLGTRTLATGFWALTSEIDYVAAAPYALLMILLSLPLTGILYVQSQKLAGL
ncbi:iron ABC transporter permease [Enterobacter sp. CC120223-11]|uniref:ABC transporter permease n=1 Tax=Enterobacter sp. CC120223-11 TaxID=1378073 RepID=UPI000BD0B3C0|nr:iron ABC transporter permease [Enterobacter sp. CC120223-11]SNY62395.1 iron(III) transport system permease protein [Enterobacter sp. CC120223-11]